MTAHTLLPPTGFIDPALAGTREIETLRVDVQEATGSLAAATGERVPAELAAEDKAVAAAQWLRHLLHEHAQCSREVSVQLVFEGPHGKKVQLTIPGAWSAEMVHELSVLLSGNAVRWTASPPAEQPGEIGTAEVAKILGVSVPTAKKVLDRGDIPSRLTPGGHRRVRQQDAVAWRATRDAQRASLRTLVQMAKDDEVTGAGRLPSEVQEDPMDES